MDPRIKVRDLIQEKTKLDDIYRDDLEIGIYNWCIDYANSKKIFKSWKNNRFTMLYLEKARSILSNIDQTSYLQNQGLLTRLNDKEFLPHEVAFMKPDILFPERWKDTTEAYFKKYEHAYENKVEAMSSDYKCGKCRKRRVVYHEIFSRSADEAAVIHICCLECGNRWKIG
jgi:transcription elongation factor S-II